MLIKYLRWVNDTTGTPLKYTNFYPHAKRKENETCAVLNLGTYGMLNDTHYPGYWFYYNCKNVVKKVICHAPRKKS